MNFLPKKPRRLSLWRPSWGAKDCVLLPRQLHVVHNDDTDTHGVGVHHDDVLVLWDQILGLHHGVCQRVGVQGNVGHLSDPEPHGVGGHHGDVQVLGDQVLDHAHNRQKIMSEIAGCRCRGHCRVVCLIHLEWMMQYWSFEKSNAFNFPVPPPLLSFSLLSRAFPTRPVLNLFANLFAAQPQPSLPAQCPAAWQYFQGAPRFRILFCDSVWTHISETNPEYPEVINWGDTDL